MNLVIFLKLKSWKFRNDVLKIIFPFPSPPRREVSWRVWMVGEAVSGYFWSITSGGFVYSSRSAMSLCSNCSTAILFNYCPPGLTVEIPLYKCFEPNSHSCRSFHWDSYFRIIVYVKTSGATQIFHSNKSPFL